MLLWFAFFFKGFESLTNINKVKSYQDQHLPTLEAESGSALEIFEALKEIAFPRSLPPSPPWIQHLQHWQLHTNSPEVLTSALDVKGIYWSDVDYVGVGQPSDLAKSDSCVLAPWARRGGKVSHATGTTPQNWSGPSRGATVHQQQFLHNPGREIVSSTGKDECNNMIVCRPWEGWRGKNAKEHFPNC